MRRSEWTKCRCVTTPVCVPWSSCPFRDTANSHYMGLGAVDFEIPPGLERNSRDSIHIHSV
eukprot:919265-Rhodomonas_salina.1